MSKKHPTYLIKKGNVFAFQVYIPVPLRAHGTPASISRSLRTNVRRDAQALSRRLAKASHQMFDDVYAGRLDREALPGRIRALVDEALGAPTVDQAVAEFAAELDAMWNSPVPLVVPPEPEPVHPHVHVVLHNRADGPTYRTRFEAFERGPAQPHRVRRWTVLRDVPSPEHSNVRRRLGILSPSEYAALFDSL